MLPIQTLVGGNAPAAAGSSPQALRTGPSGELIAQELHGRYYEACVRKGLFSGGTLAGVTLSAGFATTYTGLCLTNPLGSNVNLVPNKLTLNALVAQTAALGIGLMSGYNNGTAVTQTTPLVPLSNFVGQPTGVGLLASATTLPTAPTRAMILATLLTGAITTQVQGGEIIDLEGSWVVPPGGYLCVYSTAASVASSVLLGLQWEEVSTTI